MTPDSPQARIDRAHDEATHPLPRYGDLKQKVFDVLRKHAVLVEGGGTLGDVCDDVLAALGYTKPPADPADDSDLLDYRGGSGGRKS